MLLGIESLGVNKWAIINDTTNRRIGTVSFGRVPLRGVRGRPLKAVERAAMRSFLIHRICLNLRKYPRLRGVDKKIEKAFGITRAA